MEDKNKETELMQAISFELNRLAKNDVTVLTIPYTNRKVRIGWINKGTSRKISDLLHTEGVKAKDEDTVLCKAAAYIVLNGYWKIKLFHWIVWRWYAYIYQYKDYQLYKIIEEGKKKVQQAPYFLAMGLLNALDDTLAQQTMDKTVHSRQSHS